MPPEIARRHGHAKNMVQRARSAAGESYDATDAARNVVFVRFLACSVTLQYLVLFGAQSPDISRISKRA